MVSDGDIRYSTVDEVITVGMNSIVGALGEIHTDGDKCRVER